MSLREVKTGTHGGSLKAGTDVETGGLLLAALLSWTSRAPAQWPMSHPLPASGLSSMQSWEGGARLSYSPLSHLVERPEGQEVPREDRECTLGVSALICCYS